MVVNKNAPLLQHLLDVSKAQWAGREPARSGQHDRQRIVLLSLYLVKSAVEQIVAKIKYGLYCRLRLARQDLSDA